MVGHSEGRGEGATADRATADRENKQQIKSRGRRKGKRFLKCMTINAQSLANKMNELKMLLDEKSKV